MLLSALAQKSIVRVIVISAIITMSIGQCTYASYYKTISKALGFGDKTKNGYTFAIKGHSFTITDEHQKIGALAVFAGFCLYACYKVYKTQQKRKLPENQVKKFFLKLVGKK